MEPKLQITSGMDKDLLSHGSLVAETLSNMKLENTASPWVRLETLGLFDFDNYDEISGMEPVSLDTAEKQNEFNRLIAQDAQRFFWTGGIVDHQNQLVGWSNPNSRTIRFSDSPHWSHTGG